MILSKSTQPSQTQRKARRVSRRFVSEVALLEERRLLSDVTAPTTAANPVGTLGLNGYYTGPVTVNLSATDVDDAASSLKTEFRVNGGPLTAGNTINLTDDGTYNLQYFSEDPAGNVEATHTLIIKIDQTPPVVSVSPTPTTLWPPNGKLVTVTVSGLASDKLSGVNPVLRYRVDDEYRIVQPSGTTTLTPVTTQSGAILSGSYSFTIMLQARRAGQDHDGRHYAIFVTAADLAGNSSTASAQVIVPHDQGQHLGNPGFGGTQGNARGRQGNGHGHGHSHNKGVTQFPTVPSMIAPNPAESGDQSPGQSGSQESHGHGASNDNGQGQGNDNGQGHGNDHAHGKGGD